MKITLSQKNKNTMKIQDIKMLKLFGSVKDVDSLLKAELEGFNIAYKTIDTAMPGATILHEAAKCCYLELLEYLIYNRKMDVNDLDDDTCTPLGYVVNDETLYNLKELNEIGTVNEGNQNKDDILKCLDFLLKIEAEAVYCGREYSKDWVLNYKRQLIAT